MSDCASCHSCELGLGTRKWWKWHNIMLNRLVDKREGVELSPFFTLAGDVLKVVSEYVFMAFSVVGGACL